MEASLQHSRVHPEDYAPQMTGEDVGFMALFLVILIVAAIRWST
jgi:hypothetical protein